MIYILWLKDPYELSSLRLMKVNTTMWLAKVWACDQKFVNPDNLPDSFASMHIHIHEFTVHVNSQTSHAAGASIHFSEWGGGGGASVAI